MTATDTRALTIIFTALVLTLVTAQAYATGATPFGVLAAVAFATLALILAWARVKHRRELPPVPRKLQRNMTDAEVEYAAHEAIDHPGGPWGRATATPDFEHLAASGIRTSNDFAVARVRYPNGLHIVALSPAGNSYVATMPPVCMLLDASAIVTHIANCPDRIVSPADKAAALAVREFLEHRAKRTRRIA